MFVWFKTKLKLSHFVMLVWHISDLSLLSMLKIQTNPLFFQDILVIRAFPREDDLSAALSAPTDATLFSRDTRAQIFPSERSVSTQKSHFINYNQALSINIFFPLFGWVLALAALQHLENAKKSNATFVFPALVVPGKTKQSRSTHSQHEEIIII